MFGQSERSSRLSLLPSFLERYGFNDLRDQALFQQALQELVRSGIYLNLTGLRGENLTNWKVEFVSPARDLEKIIPLLECLLENEKMTIKLSFTVLVVQTTIDISVSKTPDLNLTEEPSKTPDSDPTQKQTIKALKSFLNGTFLNDGVKAAVTLEQDSQSIQITVGGFVFSFVIPPSLANYVTEVSIADNLKEGLHLNFLKLCTMSASYEAHSHGHSHGPTTHPLFKFKLNTNPTPPKKK